MAFLKVSLLVAVMAALGMALPQYESPAPPVYVEPVPAPEPPASYSFSYDNNDPDSGNFFGHAEQREGDNSSGEYRVLLPDGRTQIVKYKVDGNGYVAQVVYEQTISPAPPPPSSDGGYQ